MTVIVLNWNGAEDTVQCLAALRQSTYDNYEIVVVDNGSSDASVEGIRASFPSVEVIETGDNLGYAGGNNAGIRHALERGSAYIWILNNDTVADPDCLRQMVATAESDPDIGMVGSKIYYLDAPRTIWYAGGTVDLKSGRTCHIGKDRTDDGTYGVPGETGYITGCSILVRRRTVEMLGPMDEAYFLYYEDVDWSLKARRAGWKLFYEPKAVLYHAEGAQSESRYTDRFIYYTLRNRLYFMKRFAGAPTLKCHLLQLKSALYFSKCALHTKGGIASALSLAAAAYRDYHTGRMGHKKP